MINFICSKDPYRIPPCGLTRRFKFGFVSTKCINTFFISQPLPQIHHIFFRQTDNWYVVHVHVCMISKSAFSSIVTPFRRSQLRDFVCPFLVPIRTYLFTSSPTFTHTWHNSIETRDLMIKLITSDAKCYVCGLAIISCFIRD